MISFYTYNNTSFNYSPYLNIAFNAKRGYPILIA